MTDAVLDLFSHVLFHLGDNQVTVAELVGFLTGALCVALAAAERISNFPLGIANSASFLLLFLATGLYANAWLQVLYIVLGAMGWLTWLRLGADSGRLRVSDASPALLGALAAGVAAGTAVLVPILRDAGDPAPLLDALTTSLSVAAQVLLNLKKLQTWWVWIAVDLIYLPFCVHQGLLLTAAVYALFLALCVAGLRGWRSARAAGALGYAEAPA